MPTTMRFRRCGGACDSQAANSYAMAVRTRPEHAPAHYALAGVLELQGQADAAVASYEEVRCDERQRA